MPLPTVSKVDYARRKVRTEIEAGRISKPDACERCGGVGPTSSDGRSTIHAHHHDYDLPVDVEWLCASCHRQETPLPSVIGAPSFGSKNGQSRFTEAQVIEARRLRGDGLSYPKIAKYFGRSVSATFDAVNGKTWAIAARKAGAS